MKIKKLLSILLVAAFACAALASCNKLATKSAAEGALTYIGLRINPEIEMVTDQTGTVVSANAVNADGEVVLSAVELEGKTAEDAAVAFTETAVELGYMDPANNKDTVYVDVEGENTEIAEKVEKSLSDKIMKFFEKKGITAKVSKEVLDTYLAKADEWGISAGQTKLIMRALSANPELTYDELLNMTVKELLELLKNDKHGKKISADLKESYKDKIEDIKEEFEDLFELREDIEDIEEELKEEDLTDEERAALEKELAEKKEALKALEEEYKAKINAVKDEFFASSEAARKEFRKEAEERKQAKKDGKDFHDHDEDEDEDDDDDKHDGKHDAEDETDESDEIDDDDDKRGEKKHDNKDSHKGAKETEAPTETTAA